MQGIRNRGRAEYWAPRLFRNSYTYRGERRWVSGWCVKIQWKGVRRTIRLRSGERSEAAEEAARWWEELQRAGWGALEGRSGPAQGRIRADPAGRELDGDREDREDAIGPRKYVSDLTPGFDRELFVALPVEGRLEHYALGTEEPNAGRWRARELREALRRDGPDYFRLAHVREATVAVFWHPNPMACTYTTLLTHPAVAAMAVASAGTGGGGRADGVGAAGGGRGRGWRVMVVESDGGVRRALAEWLSRDPGVARVDGVPLASELPEGGSWDLVLANREQPAAALRGRAGREEEGGPRVVTHGVFADSDAIFASFSGVSRGYVLCRVAPSRLLAPLTGAFPEGPPRLAVEGDRQIKRYFQSVFDPGEAAAGQPAGLTGRELEILDLLARGFSDKEVAHELGLSVWTVHSHLKRIFAKYGVRTRTEAVVRHLQK